MPAAGVAAGTGGQPQAPSYGAPARRREAAGRTCNGRSIV